ncbi:dethiobiotin synthase [Clostridium sp. ATCC 25772]|uniref:dethiobiotin synthase n=1 Tax=Clostridium sp. ATCC 25772 TaxID=1676991 RepID=UPI000784C1FC|nr:dethiobiotin synthase [Clostridium sp. ATCC 25772]
MTKGIFVVGTDTDVGKTIVTAGIIYILRKNGYNAIYFKAALSGALKIDGELIPGDTKLVSEVSNLEEPYENITPYIYKSAVSPHLAAKIENNLIDLNKIRKKYNYLKEKYDYIIAEGSGGIICPLIDGGRGVYILKDLINDLGMSTIIIANAGLGTINHTVLTVKYLQSLNIKINGIIINNYENNAICNDNIKMIEKLTGVSIIGKLSKIENLQVNVVDRIRNNADKDLKLENIIKCMDFL